MLHVLNRELDADFPVEEFDYVCIWNERRACIEMGLRATRAMSIPVRKLGLEIRFEAGEQLHNEVSCKFTKETAGEELGAAGLRLAAWYTDPRDRFAVALATPA